MTSYAKISISLPHATLENADRECRASGESRSELFRRAVEEYLRERRRREAAERYVAGYVAEPETAYDEQIADQTAAEALSQDVWE